MAAIITDDFRRNAAQLLKENIEAGTNKYFIGIGKSDSYDKDSSENEETSASFTLPTPVASRKQELEILNNLTTLSRVGTSTGAYRVMPRVAFQTGKRYKIYDYSDPNCFFAESVGGNAFEPCYVINGDLELFICLKNNGTTTTVTADEPTVTATNNTVWQTGGDGYGMITVNTDAYRWAYVCTFARDSGFFTKQFASIGNAGSTSVQNETLPNVDGSGTPSEKSGGLLYGFKILDGGAGYTNASYVAGVNSFTIRISGLKVDASGNSDQDYTTLNSDIACTATVSGGAVTAITLPLNGSSQVDLTNVGIVYAKATTPAAGAGTPTRHAILEPLIAPLEGFGGDNLKLLPSYYCGVRANFEDDLGGDGLFVPFRQVSLLKDPVLNTDHDDDPAVGSNYAVGDAAKALRYVACTSSLPTGLTSGDILFDNSESTVQAALDADKNVAIFDHLDTTNNRLYYHTNYDEDDSQHMMELADGGGTLKWFDASAGSVGSGTVAYTGNPDYPEWDITDFELQDTTQKYGTLNGDVLFVENRQKVTRADEQIEEVRLIVQF